ncbi:secreted RxLR effector protein 161-like [Zingiber officinale]|uniref:secreted RxLR effector protein 161-like n=1 Tax=Zingiber officinale TaxID=94328 RepID=UPI001C4C30BC|nr:secreted RxLR effector protein 161-like [Zingiber officinale]
MTEFEMSDLGLLSYYLEIEVEQQKSRILLRQSAYAKKILSQFKMTDCNSTKHPMESKTRLHKDLEETQVDATEYRRIIGCLRYLLHTQPDLSYSVGMASRYMERPTIMHHKVVKQILRYLKGTIYFGLAYIKEPQEIGVFGYSDSDLAEDLDGRKSTSGMTFYFNESLVFRNSQKQKTVALLSCEAEFMATTTVTCHALWLRSLASELTGVEPKSGADALTKALPGVKLAVMQQLLGVHDLEPCQD